MTKVTLPANDATFLGNVSPSQSGPVSVLSSCANTFGTSWPDFSSCGTGDGNLGCVPN